MYVIVSKCNTDDCEYLITPKYLGYNGGITKEKLTILARGKTNENLKSNYSK